MWNSAPKRWPKTDRELADEKEQSLRSQIGYLRNCIEKIQDQKIERRFEKKLMLKIDGEWINTSFTADDLYRAYTRANTHVVDIAFMQPVSIPLDIAVVKNDYSHVNVVRFSLYKENWVRVPYTGLYTDAQAAKWSF